MQRSPYQHGYSCDSIALWGNMGSLRHFSDLYYGKRRARQSGCVDRLFIVSVINLNLLMVKGRSDLLLRLEIIKKSISLSMIIVGATISVEAICWAGALYAQIAIFINTYYTGKILGLTWWKQQKDYLPYFALAALCCTPAWFITQTSWHSLVQLTAGGSCAFILYLGTLHILKEAAYVELYTTLRGNRWFRWLPAI